MKNLQEDKREEQMVLTQAQKREYAILKEYGFCIITDRRRNKVYMQLVKKGLATLPPSGSHNSDCYFRLTQTNQLTDKK